jgi:hypothetical protein
MRSAALALMLCGVLPTMPHSRHADPSSTRKPRGIYAVVVMDSGRAPDLKALLNNSAVSGLAIRMFWSSLQPAQDKFDFKTLDAAFDSADAVHKTIQLIIVPGFGTPAWVLNELSTCDSALTAPATGGGKGKADKAHGKNKERQVGGHPGEATSAPKCGKASFEVSEGKASGQTQELPLPWNPVYKRLWRAFLTEVASRYGKRDAFVSISVAGPTAESVETILPRTGSQLDRWGELLQMFYTDPKYQQSDQAFIDEWDAAATMYGDVFSDVTLVLTRGSGLLDFTKGQGKDAEASIVSAFAGHKLGTNARATQTSGMKACRETKSGIQGVKETASGGTVLGGAQFNTSFSQKPAAEGCTDCNAEAKVCTIITPAEALANVLKVYFDGTPDGESYGATKGSARMNYMQVYEKDIEFANGDSKVQAALDLASKRLLDQARE